MRVRLAAVSLPTTEALSQGTRLGERYVIGSELGRGATGIVYSAARVSGEGDVALKVIHSELVADPQIRGRFKREAAILRRLTGEHVCPVIDFAELPDPKGGPALLCLALEKIPGPTLESIERTEGPLEIARAIQIMIEICDALRVAHAEGVVHRDLKPANVILVGGKRVVVVDFGLGKIVSGASTGTTGLTAHGMIFGTPTFMSPEQARGEELDARSDIYSAGIILYELLTGSVPFSSKSPVAVLSMQSEEAPEAPRARAPGRAISVELEAICLRAMAKRAGDRFQTAPEFAEALAKLRVPSSSTTGKAGGQVERTMPAIPRATRDSSAPRRVPDSKRGAPPSERPGALPRAWIVVYVLSVVLSVAVGVAVATLR